MSNVQNQQLQTAIDNLALILQLWVPVLAEIKQMNQALETLPNNLSILQNRVNKLNQANTYIQKNSLSQERLEQINQLQGFEIKIEKQIGDLLALKERVEALQEQCQINQTKFMKKVP
jgi:hypothetical protein